MTLIFAYLAGLLTLINPCVLPVLPIVVTGALGKHRLGPVAMAAGMSLSFVILGLTVAAFGHAIGLTEDRLNGIAAIGMLAFGAALLMPQAGALFQTATAGFASRADAGIDRTQGAGLAGQAAGGVLLGAAWSPCIGPTLGGAIALASGGGSLWQAGAIMAAFAAGVATLILALAYGARDLLMRNRARAQALAIRARPMMGLVFIAVGLAMLSGVMHLIEALAVQHMPLWLQDLSVSI
ncbi:cytochrome c biogenesis CcdA family protein [Paracoccus seriniphilus]|uniref:Cytochrome C biogenesis protein transmembrane region n=1 Tax=Paracoccus seriniphilus TaxID=184748 RepID=A0A239PY48_9RHOB|nr:cytochrome c biogenesis protein CcdA [Paracoccus seriniphilus]WCR14111.1 sulfite exporter TauE/SafE family protein [Paracoccus seriniphilus]SNT75018.1 Cytochrome C biogenesis protein transmembrane region [Paracoccus seriniphilus]